MFSSPKGTFNALIYMHRYTPSTVSVVLNEYLREFRTKLEARRGNYEQTSISGSASASEKTQALKMMQKDPKRAMAMLESEPWLKAAFVELMGQMGGHFSALGEQQEQQKQQAAQQAARQAAPEAVPEAEMGPMAQDALRRHRTGDLPAPATSDEQKQVDAVLQDEELRGILMDPGTQHLLRSCSDPSALQKAMRDPQTRAKFEKLAKAGLIRIEG